MTKDDRPGKIPPEAMEDMKRELLGIGGASSPKSGKFKPGQSGNPKGRPKRSPSESPSGMLPIHEALLREIDRTVTMREGGASTVIGRRQALATAVVRGALNGVAPTLRLAFELTAIAEQSEAADIAHEHEVFERYCANGRDLIAMAHRNAEPEPQILPHPDDVMIVAGRRVWFAGPSTPEQLDKCKHAAAVRDVLIIQEALDQKLAGNEPPLAAWMAACVLNLRLPKRMQISDNEMQFRLMRFEVVPKRKLLKQAYRAWQTVGFDKPRGWLSPPRNLLVKRLEIGVDLAVCATRGELNVEAMARGEFDDAALAFMARHELAA